MSAFIRRATESPEPVAVQASIVDAFAGLAAELVHWPGLGLTSLTRSSVSSSRMPDDEPVQGGWWESFDTDHWCAEARTNGVGGYPRHSEWGDSIEDAVTNLTTSLRKRRESPHNYVHVMDDAVLVTGCADCERDHRMLFPDCECDDIASHGSLR